MARLLIVDDEAANLRALCDSLTASGYETQGCGHGQDAMAVLQTQRFDLLLSDLRMPGMDGIDLLREALAHDPTMVAVLMTGHGTISTAVQAMQVGAIDYVLKPFKLSAAMPVIERALGVRALRQQNAALEAQVRKQMEDLVMANGDLDAFSYSVSHDLRAPIQVVDGFAAALESAHLEQLDQKGLHYVKRIRAGVQRMSDLVDGLLRLSRLSRQPLERCRIDVAQLVRGVSDNLREEQIAGADQITVDARLPPVQADPVLLRQVYANLLSNACKFTSRLDQPVVQVGFAVVDGECIYCVSDNGAGFDMAYVAKLFEPFQRLHSNKEFAGLGIGLCIVERIVHRHGGRIWAESAPGQGARFHFTLGPA